MRPAPFWSWNDKLDPEECRRQIKEMAEEGWGSFFMHSRVGLCTPYLSKEWFDLCNICAEEAEKYGMIAWLYDEDRYPSGFAGGFITKDGRFRRRALIFTTIKREEDATFADGKVTFETNHFSDYIVVFEKKGLSGYHRIG